MFYEYFKFIISSHRVDSNQVFPCWNSHYYFKVITPNNNNLHGTRPDKVIRKGGNIQFVYEEDDDDSVQWCVEQDDMKLEKKKKDDDDERPITPIPQKR